MQGLVSRWSRAVIAGLCLTLPSAGIAQSDAPDCAARSDSVMRSNAKPETLLGMRACPARTGLVRLWTSQAALAGYDADALRASTSGVNDGEVFSAVLAAAARNDVAREARLGALGALMTYVAAELVPTRAYLTQAHLGDAVPRASAYSTIAGATPLPASARRDVAATISAIARGDPDPVVAKAARLLRQSLAYSHPELISVDTSAVTLEAGCGPRVLVRSAAEIVLPLRIRVLGSRYSERFDVVGVGSSKPLLLALPPGTVVAELAGHELARLSTRTAPCPANLTRF
jgi:hypothetical protein